MAITDAQKVDLRRLMGYPAYGGGDAGFNNWRFFQAYGLIEFRFLHMTSDEETVVLDHLTKCLQLETDIYGVRENIDTAAAAVWTRNPDELRERVALLNYWRNRICQFFGVPAGPHMGGSRNVQLVI